MRKLSKLFALLLCLSMMVGLTGLTALASDDYREPMTLTVFDELANYAGEQAGWFAKVLEDKFNVKMNIISTNLDPNAYQTRMSSGDLGDLVIFGDMGEHFLNAVNAGMILDWNEVDWEDYEHLVDVTTPSLEKVTKYIEDNASKSGIWGFTHNISYDRDSWDVVIEPNYGMQARWDAYVLAGKPELNTIDDLVPFLKALQEAVPENEFGEKVYAYGGFSDWEDSVMKFTWDLMTWYGYAEYDFMGVNWDNGDVVNPLEEDSLYKQMLSINNQLYREGLFDPESISQNFDAYNTKLTSGRYLMALWGWLAPNFNTPERLEQEVGFVQMSIGDDAPVVQAGIMAGGNRVWAIGSNAQDPDRVLEILDWLCSTDGIMTYHNGPQGLTWDYDENGMPYGTEYGWQAWRDVENTDVPAEWGGGKYRDGQSALNNTTVMANAMDPEGGFYYNHEAWEDGIELLENPLRLAWGEEYANGARTGVEFLRSTERYTLHPGTSYSYADKGDDLNAKRGQFAPIMKEYSWKCVYATSDEEFEATWNEMVQKCKDFGYDDVVDFYMVEIQNKLDAIAEGI